MGVRFGNLVSQVFTVLYFVSYFEFSILDMLYCMLIDTVTLLIDTK